MKSLKINAVLNIFRTIIGLIFPLITFPYSSRVLGPEGIGRVNFPLSIISYFSLIATLGISTYATREVSKQRDNKEAQNQLVKELFTINIISTIVSYILLGISLFTIPKFSDYRVLLLICSITILFSTLGMEWLYIANEEYTYITFRSILFQFISFILLFCIVKTNTDYIQYAIVCICASVGSNLCNFIHSRKWISFKGTNKLQLKRHLKPIFILFAYSLASSVFTILDTSMIGFLSDDTQVGYYSASIKIVRIIRDLFPAVFSVFFARIVYYYSHNEFDNFKKLSRKTILFIFCFSLPLSTGLCLLSKPIILLLCGDKYLYSISSIMVITPLIIFSGISGFLGGQILITMGKEKLYLITILIASFIDIILNFICIPKFGSFGASTATMVAEGSIFIIYLFLLRSFLKELNLNKCVIHFIIATIIMGITVYFVSQIFINNNLIQLIISTISGIMVYGIMLLILKDDFFFEMVNMIKESIIKRIKR